MSKVASTIAAFHQCKLKNAHSKAGNKHESNNAFCSGVIKLENKKETYSSPPPLASSTLTFSLPSHHNHISPSHTNICCDSPTCTPACAPPCVAFYAHIATYHTACISDTSVSCTTHTSCYCRSSLHCENVL